jgi:hypothetical protein
MMDGKKSKSWKVHLWENLENFRKILGKLFEKLEKSCGNLGNFGKNKIFPGFHDSSKIFLRFSERFPKFFTKLFRNFPKIFPIILTFSSRSFQDFPKIFTKFSQDFYKVFLKKLKCFLKVILRFYQKNSKTFPSFPKLKKKCAKQNLRSEIFVRFLKGFWNNQIYSSILDLFKKYWNLLEKRQTSV